VNKKTEGLIGFLKCYYFGFSERAWLSFPLSLYYPLQKRNCIISMKLDTEVLDNGLQQFKDMARPGLPAIF